MNDTKKVFRKKGACSHTFFYLLNRAFGHNDGEAEQATDPLAGGILRYGHQCGMLWGAAMAVGAEAYRRRTDDIGRAIASAVQATQGILASFTKRTNTVNCRAITKTDFYNRWQMVKFMLFRSRGCFQMAEDWAPEAIQAAEAGLAEPIDPLAEDAVSCASEVVRRMGGTEQEVVTVAGLAGGLGLSGAGCGALAAAIWLRSKTWMAENPGQSSYENAYALETFEVFRKATKGEVTCQGICGRCFSNLQDHSDYIRQGGCAELMEALTS